MQLLGSTPTHGDTGPPERERKGAQGEQESICHEPRQLAERTQRTTQLQESARQRARHQRRLHRQQVQHHRVEQEPGAHESRREQVLHAQPPPEQSGSELFAIRWRHHRRTRRSLPEAREQQPVAVGQL